MDRKRLAQTIYALTAVWVLIGALSMYTGWLNAFFFDTDRAHVQGIDFFPIERAWLNLIDGRSQYDTFHSSYGPRATWYLYHPALALVVGPILMAFAPMTAYGVWIAISLLLLIASAVVIAAQTSDPLRRAVIALLMLGSFPMLLVYYSGNVQSLIVLAVALIFAAIYSMQMHGATRRAERMLLAGLLISLFSKPIALAMFPLLLLMPETRRTAVRAGVIYAIVSLVCLIIPGLNPVAMPWAARLDLLTHPFIVQQTMNVYTNGLTVTQPMQDNFIHWLAMAGMADFRMMHVDVYSLPAFLDGLFHTRTADALYRVPALLVLEVSILVGLMRDRAGRLEAGLLTLMASTLILFLSYGLVWEYHFTGVMAVTAMFMLRASWGWFEKVMIALGVLCWLPSLYVLLRNNDMASLATQTLLRAERLLPVVIMFVLLLVRAVKLALASRAGLRFFAPDQASPGM